MTKPLELPMSKERLERELRADLKYLRSKAVRLVDKLTITQGDIMRTRGRLQRLTNAYSGNRESSTSNIKPLTSNIS